METAEIPTFAAAEIAAKERANEAFENFGKRKFSKEYEMRGTEEDYWKRVMEHQKECFTRKRWQIPEDVNIDNLFAEFFHLLRKEKVKNIIDFMRDNGIERAKEKEFSYNQEAQSKGGQ